MSLGKPKVVAHYTYGPNGMIADYRADYLERYGEVDNKTTQLDG